MSHALRIGTRRLALLASGAALALALPLGLVAQDPEIQHYGDVAYVTGGVGQEERDVVERLAREEGLHVHVVLTSPDGSFFSDVPVRITDGQGETVLEATTDGPWLFTSLPAGQYRVQADFPAGSTRADLGVEEGAARQVILASPGS